MTQEGLLKIEELIETLWNVNDKVRAILGLDKMELIETLWNVNRNLLKDSQAMNMELIETLWNVNQRQYCSVTGGDF